MRFRHVDLEGRNAWRLIPTRVPSADLLARVADPTDYDLLNALEAKTNRRIQAFGHANPYVAAAFAYSLGGTPSRFNDGTWGTDLRRAGTGDRPGGSPFLAGPLPQGRPG